jgi:hypothetical protein
VKGDRRPTAEHTAAGPTLSRRWFPMLAITFVGEAVDLGEANRKNVRIIMLRNPTLDKVFAFSGPDVAAY